MGSTRAKLSVYPKYRFPNEASDRQAQRATEIFVRTYSLSRRAVVPDESVPQLVDLGTAMMDAVEGPHYTFVDPRFCKHSRSMVDQARRLRQLFREKSEHRRVIIGVRRT